MLIDREEGKPLDEQVLAGEMDRAVRDVVAKQAAAGIDIGNDGEQQRVAFQTYVARRMYGFAGESKRRRGREWIGQNDTLLRLSDTSFNRLYATILTSVSGEGGREVAAARTRRQANRIIEAVLEYVRRIMTGGPWQPADAPADDAGAAPRTPARLPTGR